MRLSFHEPVGALGVLLVFGITASVIASAVTGRILSWVRIGPYLALATMLSALALAAEALAPSVWVFTGGMVVFGLGFGALDSSLNAHAAGHFGARDINLMHASYGLGATIGPLLVTALLSDGLTWRWAYGIIAIAQAALAVVFTLAAGAGVRARLLRRRPCLAWTGCRLGAVGEPGTGSRHRRSFSALWCSPPLRLESSPE